jgi:hypothetical protein
MFAIRSSTDGDASDISIIRYLYSEFLIGMSTRRSIEYVQWGQVLSNRRE